MNPLKTWEDHLWESTPPEFLLRFSDKSSLEIREDWRIIYADTVSQYCQKRGLDSEVEEGLRIYVKTWFEAQEDATCPNCGTHGLFTDTVEDEETGWESSVTYCTTCDWEEMW